MKIFLLLLLLFVCGPLLCLLGYRIDWNNSKELFNFGRTPETRAIVCAFACVLCVLLVIIACLKWRNKRNSVFGGEFNEDHKISLRQLMHDSRVRIDLRPRRMFIFKLGPVYTVDEILADTTEELKPLQEFVLDVSGNPEKSKPIAEYREKPKRERSSVKTDSKQKEGVENMTEMITSMFAPCVTKTQFEDDYESFLCPKIAKISKESKEQFCLPPGGYEQAMQRSFEDESVIYSSEMAENTKQTVKAYYMMAGGFSSDLRRVSEEEQARKQDEREFRVLQVEMEAENSQDDIVVSEKIEIPPKSRELRFIKGKQKVLGQTCPPGELKDGNIISRTEKKVDSRPRWVYKDYAIVACGMTAVVLVSVSVYRFFRR